MKKHFKNRLPCFGKPESDKISITEDISENAVREAQGNRAGHKRSGMQSQDNRAGYKSSRPAGGGKHMTIEHAIKVAGPQRETSTGK